MLISTFPKAIFQLKNLVELRVDNTMIGGRFPVELSTLHNLQYLYLGNNSFTGTIPREMWSSLTNLKELSLECNYFQGARPKVESNITASLDYNCWQSEPALDSACVRNLNCLNFQLYTGNGKCPACPSGQNLVNSTTCICYAVPGHSKRKLAIGVIIGMILGTALLLLLLLSYHWWRIRHRPKKNPEPFDYFQSDRAGSMDLRGSLHPWEVPGGVQHFTLEELKRATKGFGRANEIGEGGFGKVFVGTFPGGWTLAIKRAGPANSSELFRNEVLLLSRLHHKNLVRLEGFCDDTGQQDVMRAAFFATTVQPNE